MQLNLFELRGNGKPSLEELVYKARLFPFESENRHRVLCEMARIHSGLGARLHKEIGNGLEYGAIIGFLWEAMIMLPDSYDPSKGKATTKLASITKNLAYKFLYDTHYTGSVRTPLRNKKFVAVGIEPDGDIGLLEVNREWDVELLVDSQCYDDSNDAIIGEATYHGINQSKTSRTTRAIQGRILRTSFATRRTR